jgi:hypothetical protein
LSSGRASLVKACQSSNIVVRTHWTPHTSHWTHQLNSSIIGRSKVHEPKQRVHARITGLGAGCSRMSAQLECTGYQGSRLAEPATVSP